MREGGNSEQGPDQADLDNLYQALANTGINNLDPDLKEAYYNKNNGDNLTQQEVDEVNRDYAFEEVSFNKDTNTLTIKVNESINASSFEFDTNVTIGGITADFSLPATTTSNPELIQFVEEGLQGNQNADEGVWKNALGNDANLNFDSSTNTLTVNFGNLLNGTVEGAEKATYLAIIVKGNNIDYGSMFDSAYYRVETGY